MTGTRQVERVMCWKHNVVILECYELTPHHFKYAYHHHVTMFTPDVTPLTLIED
jgi:hypothetical protein